jgi:hypothetical protein
MADQTRHPSGAIENCRSIRQIDLRDPALYEASIEWLRSNVVVKKRAADQVLQLNVALPKGSAVLYMAPSNHYLMGFRGADQICLLNDAKTVEFQKALAAELKSTPIEILNRFGAHHGIGGLETVNEKNPTGRVFSREDLDQVHKLSLYSRRTSLSFDPLRPYMSLMVCMISEAARAPMLGNDFANMLYYGGKVWVDESVQSYQNAIEITTLARQVFPTYPRHLAVEKLQKRARELGDLIPKIESHLGLKDRKVMIGLVLAGRASPPPVVASDVVRLRQMCGEMRLSDPEKITGLFSLRDSESAFRAAKQGIIVPAIGQEI